MNATRALHRAAASTRARLWGRPPLRGAHSTARSGGRGRSAASTAIFFGVPVAVTFSLGVWQVKRLERKKELIAAREQTLQLEPLDEEALEDGAGKHDFRRIVLRGELHHGHEMLVGPRSAPAGLPQAALQWGGSSGFLVVTPMRTQAGRVALVLRGWVPVRLVDRERRSTAAVVPLSFIEDQRPLAEYGDTDECSAVTISGVVRRADEKNRFMPENNPAKNDWFYIDTKAMLKSVGVDVVNDVDVPFVELAKPLPSNGWPFPRSESDFLSFRTPPSTHVTYAVTWFMLSGALALLSRNRVKHARAR